MTGSVQRRVAVHDSSRRKQAQLLFWQVQGLLYFPGFFWLAPAVNKVWHRVFQTDIFVGAHLFWCGMVTLALSLLGSYYCKRQDPFMDKDSFFGFLNFFGGIFVNRAYVCVIIGYMLLLAGG